MGSKRRQSRGASEREMLRWAAALGWEVKRRNGMGHMPLWHPVSGETLPIPGHPIGRQRMNVRAQLRRLGAAAALVLLLGVTSAGAQSVPDPARTPGALNPAVTQETIGETICVPGWTRTVRPPVQVTNAIKRRLWIVAGSPGSISDYELDHEIPLEGGGAPRDLRNLWLEPWDSPDGWGAGAKDRLENRVRALICDGRITLEQGQAAFVPDWTAGYRRYIGERP